MKENLSRVPVVCRRCRKESLAELSKESVTEALNDGTPSTYLRLVTARRGRQVTSNKNSCVIIYMRRTCRLAKDPNLSYCLRAQMRREGGPPRLDVISPAASTDAAPVPSV